MYEAIKDKEVKTRVPHFCAWCGAFMPEGVLARYRAYKFDGDFMNDWMHDDCARAMDTIDPDDFPDGFVEGGFKRGTTERY